MQQWYVPQQLLKCSKIWLLAVKTTHIYAYIYAAHHFASRMCALFNQTLQHSKCTVTDLDHKLRHTDTTLQNLCSVLDQTGHLLLLTHLAKAQWFIVSDCDLGLFAGLPVWVTRKAFSIDTVRQLENENTFGILVLHRCMHTCKTNCHHIALMDHTRSIYNCHAFWKEGNAGWMLAGKINIEISFHPASMSQMASSLRTLSGSGRTRIAGNYTMLSIATVLPDPLNIESGSVK